MGTQLPSPKRGRIPPPIFGPYVYCGQTAGCIRISHGTEVGLGPGDIVLDGDPAELPLKEAQPPIFGLSIVAKRLSSCTDGCPKYGITSLASSIFHLLQLFCGGEGEFIFDDKSTKMRRLPCLQQNTCKTEITILMHGCMYHIRS